jgi:hypothetical protein
MQNAIFEVNQFKEGRAKWSFLEILRIWEQGLYQQLPNAILDLFQVSICC